MGRSRSSRSPTPAASSPAGGGSGGMMTRKPPTHPDENNPQHKANLVRNLDRNDAEIAALVACNRTLRTLRDEIRRRHGEEILLDVGEGTVRLATGQQLGGSVRPKVVRVVPGVVVDADGHRKLMEERVAQILRERALRADGGGGGGGGDDGDDVKENGDAGEAEAEASAPTNSTNDDEDDDASIIRTIPPDEVPLDDPDHEADPSDPSTRTNLVRAFLLRLHLRRRILNRLFRRMNRLARAMDGESAISSGLNGPTPPRYGDFRFVLDVGDEGDEDPESFQQFEARFREKAEARRRVEECRSQRRNEEVGGVEKDGDGDEVMADADTGAGEEATSTSPPSDAAKLVLPQEDEDDLKVLMETDVGRDKMVTYQDLTKSLQALGGGPPLKSKTPTNKAEIEAATTAAAADMAAEAEAKAETEAEGPPSAIEVKAEAEQHEQELAATENGVANRTSDTPAAKTDDNEKEEEMPPLPELVPGKIRKIVTLPLAASDPPPEERDFSSAKFTSAGGGGIGALSRFMNSREREIEYNRWKTDVLAKVPEQPTFAELGLENLVFGLEARRKKAAGVVDAADEDKMEVDDKVSGGDATNVDDEGKGEDVKSKKRSADDADENTSDKEEDVDDDDGTDKAKEEAAKETIKRPEIFKKKKLISLAAAPSFHSQDRHRILGVHKDLLIRSRHEKTQKLLNEANAAYNKAYAVSTDVHNRKNQLTQELNMQSAQTRAVDYNANAAHQAEIKRQRELWQKAYQQWISRRMTAGIAVPPMPVEQQASPAAAQNGSTPSTASPTNGTTSAVSGTPLTAAKSSDSAATEEEREAAAALGAVVDKVAEGGGEKKGSIYNNPSVLDNVPADAGNFPAFIVPPMNADLAAASVKEKQKEAALRKKVTEETIKLNQAEDERKKAWRQMLKFKGDLTGSSTGGRAGGGSRSQRRKPASSRRAPAPAPAASASAYRARAPASQAPAASTYAGHSAYYGHAQQQQQVQHNYAQSQAAIAAYQQAQASSAAGAARAPAPNYYSGSYGSTVLQAGYPQQQQQYVPTQQTSRPGMPTAPTGTMAMAAASAAATASSAAQQPQQLSAQAAQQALAAYQAQQPQQQQALAAAGAPPAAPSARMNPNHQQRYSQEAIRNRTYDDGSVAPAVPPKQGGDGLFQRPSGRSRKGMDWDAVHGVWRPAPGGGHDGAPPGTA